VVGVVVQLWACRLIAGSLEEVEMAMVEGLLEAQMLEVEEVELM
jgi:hypothetical protein